MNTKIKALKRGIALSLFMLIAACQPNLSDAENRSETGKSKAMEDNKNDENKNQEKVTENCVTTSTPKKSKPISELDPIDVNHKDQEIKIVPNRDPYLEKKDNKNGIEAKEVKDNCVSKDDDEK